jgi:hypothetical protein
LARKRNVKGGAFGFVRYVKVKDVEKLLKALNNVWFGDWKVVAKVASFDRFGNAQGVGGKRDEEEKIKEGEKSKFEGIRNFEGVKNGMVVRDDVAEGVAGNAPLTLENVSKKDSNVVVIPKQQYVPMYRSDVQDKLWASKGLVVTVMNGEAIPVLQRRIYDAGFSSLDLIPLGADKVLLRSSDEREVSSILSEAAEFFDHFFSTYVRWNKNIIVRERGAWVRIYGVPLHAWNLNFFKLCVYDCGRLMRVDDFTQEKQRFDYARVLIATTSQEVINVSATTVVDGVLLEFRIIEEWGFALGEDACLSDEEVATEVAHSDMDDTCDDFDGRGEVDEFLKHLSEDWHNEKNAGGVPSCEIDKHNEYQGSGACDLAHQAEKDAVQYIQHLSPRAASVVSKPTAVSDLQHVVLSHNGEGVTPHSDSQGSAAACNVFRSTRC